MTNLIRLILPALFVSAATLVVAEDRIEPEPDLLAEIEVTEKLGAEVPGNLAFTDQDGKTVLLGDFFTGKRPVVLTLNYSDCPMLCHLQLNGFVDALKQLEWSLGEEFAMVTVSIDPTELPQRAKLTKNKYMKMYERRSAQDGWHFLVGSEANIKALADSVGFGYTYNEARDEYVHAAVAMICTPSGELSRYLYGVVYEPQTIKFALLEASEGNIGNTVDQLLLFCFHYDSEAGKYAPAAENIMRLGGALTVLIVGGTLGVYWRREARRRKKAEEKSATN